MSAQQTWYAHGKLLLTGEYLVMEGAEALAIPLKLGQSLRVEKMSHSHAQLIWSARQPEGMWFRARYSLPHLNCIETTHPALSQKLALILEKTRIFNPEFLNGSRSFKVETQLEFNPEFGFGSSSTLLSNLAQWAQVNPYALQFFIWGGSAYDIACARAEGAILYTLLNGEPSVKPVKFKPPFRHQLYFVYLGHKQRTTESIEQFKEKASYSPAILERISAISSEIIKAPDLESFNELIAEHEKIVSKVVGLPTIQEKLFAKAPFQVKSLGAWGGDFVLVSSQWPKTELSTYLKNQGLDICFSWNDLIG
jgi:mevalonate kinase